LVSTAATAAPATTRPWIEAACTIDTEFGEPARAYTVLTSSPRDTSCCGYHVYRSDVRGSDQIGNITDGQDRELIEAVENDCEYMGYVVRQPAET
jgi:hypothetical protein